MCKKMYVYDHFARVNRNIRVPTAIAIALVTDKKNPVVAS